MNYKISDKKNLLDRIKRCKEIIIFDTETTGLDPLEDRIIQFSGIKVAVSERDGLYEYRELGSLDEYIRPEKPISEKIEKITSITNEFLADKQSEDDAFAKIRAFMGDNPLISGYNVGFDVAFMKALYERHGENFVYQDALDVLVYAKDLVSKDDIKEATGKDKFTQESIANVYGLADDVKFHLAIEDARVTLKLLFTFVNEFYLEPEKEKVHATVKRVLYKEGFQHDRTGAYVTNSICPAYYSYKYKQWYPTKKANQALFDTIDLDLLESDVMKMLGLSSMKDLAHFKGDSSAKKGIQGSGTAERITSINFWEKYGKKRLYVKAMDENGKWANCFFDLLTGEWNCPHVTADSLEKVCLGTKNAPDMYAIGKALCK